MLGISIYVMLPALMYILIEKYTTFSLKSIPLLKFNKLLWILKSNSKPDDKNGYKTRNFEKVLSRK